jgi:predicted phage baseplate assembly protein
MAVAPPPLETRDYQALVDDALARIPVHNPEWTNFNASDPGVTLIQLFAFLTESLYYRANQIPERNRRKFLELLGVPRRQASSARGLLTVANEHGPAERVPLGAGFEARAGNVSFAAERGLDVLPVEGLALYKQPVDDPPPELLDYHKQLYASAAAPRPKLADVRLYETVPLDPQSPDGVGLQSTVDGSLWIALLLRQGQDPPTDAARNAARAALAGATLSVGLVPVVAGSGRELAPAGTASASAATQLTFQVPRTVPGGVLPAEQSGRVAQYRNLDATFSTDVLARPGVADVGLPGADQLWPWTNLGPLEAGVGDFPPALEDTQLAERLVTWLRIRAARGSDARFLYAGVNVTTVSQRVRVAGETPGVATGEPDQAFQLANGSVVPASVRLTVGDDPPEEWSLIDDLYAAGPEVRVSDPRLPPGAPQPPPAPSRVFTLDAAEGTIRFGDGERGARPRGQLRVTYDHGLGAAGNLGAGAISSGGGLPTGMTVSNPVPTWGGVDAESVAEAEKQAARYLQHRDRMVALEDFETIVWRTPGVEIGRVDVLAAYNPELEPNAPGDAPGAVTIMVVPLRDPVTPDAPRPSRAFVDAVCDHVDPRRLVTTEVFVRGPSYRGVWVSVGIDVTPGVAVAEATEAVRRELYRFLAPVDATQPPWYEDAPHAIDQPFVHRERGWPLRKPIVALELMAVASRVPGVDYVQSLQLAEGSDAAVPEVELRGLDLPQVLGVSVVAGDALDLSEVRGLDAEPPGPATGVPVPLVPESC